MVTGLIVTASKSGRNPGDTNPRDEERLERHRDRQIAKRVIAAAESEIEYAAWRSRQALEMHARYGVEIGTREQANNLTGPYAEQAQQDRLALLWMESGVGVIQLSEPPQEQETNHD